MSTTVIHQSGRGWTEYQSYLSGTTSSAVEIARKRTHTVAVTRTRGYESYSAAETACVTATTATYNPDGSGTSAVGTWEKEGDTPFWAVIVETDTTTAWVSV